MEGLQAQVEKTHQMVMIFMESIEKERALASGKIVESSVWETSTMKPIEGEGEGSASKEIKSGTQENKVGSEEGNND